jgi:spermidine/putrescine transport system ATP-binding protein
MVKGPNQANIAISVENAHKVYGDPQRGFVALRNVSLEIRDNEFFTLLGPSGCGKTTLLRLIAGFEEVTSGAIRLFGSEIGDLPPNKRPINTVFQNYALFPHMNVAENIAFGLKMLGESKSATAARVAEILALVQLESFRDRFPSELSGGQQQRVAMARALAPRPKVLLLDEPLSALDLKLRQAMRVELKRIQRDAGITFVFVTHDQDEALAMSDRIAVIAGGEIQQVAEPTEIYCAPRNRFVAEFIGDANLLSVVVGDSNGRMVVCKTSDGTTLHATADENGHRPGKGHVVIRPERLQLRKGRVKGGLGGRISELVYLGTDTQVIVNGTTNGPLTARVQNAHNSYLDLTVGDDVTLIPDKEAVRLLAD